MTDFFIAASKSGSKIAGIVNADCMIIPQTRIAERLKDFINGIVIAERLNLSQETFRPTGVPCQGFDAFFCEVGDLDLELLEDGVIEGLARMRQGILDYGFAAVRFRRRKE